MADYVGLETGSHVLLEDGTSGLLLETVSGYVWQFTGPGYNDFLLPVSATSTTVGVSAYRDTAYSPYPGGTNPALAILANPTIGVSAQTIVDTGSAGAYNTLTATAFTPTGTGWVTVRIVSFDGTGASVVKFDVITVI